MEEYYRFYKKNYKSDTIYQKLLDDLSKMETEDSIRKWYEYKTLDECLEKRIRRFDCDSWNGTCELTSQIYKTLWQNKGDIFNKFGGDTINSFAYTFNSFMKAFMEGGRVSFRESYDKYKDEGEYRKKANELGLGEFARNVGCLGNFTLVPSGFNRYRSRLGDYFDLSLKELKETKEENWLGEVKFSQYINTFFLWDYTTKVDENHYEVDFFFKGHSEEHIFPEGDEVKKCVSNMNEKIRQRGKFMVDMLRIAEEKPKVYQNIQKYLFEENVFWGSVEEARKEIWNRFKLKEEGYPSDV